MDVTLYKHAKIQTKYAPHPPVVCLGRKAAIGAHNMIWPQDKPTFPHV